MPCLSCCWKKTGADKEDVVVEEEKDNGDSEGNFGNFTRDKIFLKSVLLFLCIFKH